MVPLLPLISAVWESDEPPDLEGVRLEVVRATSNDLIGRIVLRRWLNTTRPPTADDLLLLRAHIRYHLGELADGCPTAWSMPVVQHPHHDHPASQNAQEGTYFG